MMQSRYAIIVLCTLCCAVHASTPATQPAASDGRTAPLLEGLGDHHFPITTASELAQRYFDQGLVLAYAFNHKEAERSFREAARLDPQCAMAWWGVALVLGPHVNAAMKPEDAPKAWEAITKANQLASNASAKERDYIAALSTRYAKNPPEDRTALDLAYLDAMRELAKKHPDDVDAQALFAEAIMDSMPWNYWLPEGKHQPLTPELLATLEAVFAKAPQHPGANHLYIHAVEAGPHPEKGLAAADRLRDVAPGAGHLVHMLAHIYLRLGMYQAASRANEEAIEADQNYLDACGKQGFTPRCTTRTTSTSCGIRREWKGAAPSRSAAPARRRGTSAAAAAKTSTSPSARSRCWRWPASDDGMRSSKSLRPTGITRSTR